LSIFLVGGARGSVVVKAYATSRKAAGLRPDKMNVFFSIYLILSVTLGPAVYSASNRNKYQKQKNNFSVE
jgi:hypothetical protein